MSAKDSFARKHLLLCCGCSFPLCLFFVVFLLSLPTILLTTCPASVKIKCEDSHFCHRDKGLGERIDCACVMAADARDLWGLRACWTSTLPPLVTLLPCWSGAICSSSVRLPSQPTQGPLTMPQVHREYIPNGTHLVKDRWIAFLKKIGYDSASTTWYNLREFV